ncbi:MAG: AAA family ATPase [Planctomycetaceae bacterium]|jgi:MoxR-like ATPase|nr:AAA family ATPase [Planctomycetaceae bacterium]
MENTQSLTLLTPDEIKPLAAKARALTDELDRLLLGRSQLHRLVAIAIFSRGHVLLEGVPGVGKTALIKALGELLGLSFGRVQFTPDLMPSDILGTNILQESTGGGRQLTFQPGPIFSNILLADEINRASPKTQSALLEAMQERCVTLLGETRELPSPFFVLASQNPIELEGTYPLPEAQLDRFMFKLQVGMPEADVLQNIITSRRHGELPKANTIFSAAELNKTFEALQHIFLPTAVASYIARLVAATHPNSAETTNEVRDYVSFGASPRAAIAIAEAARSAALLMGRPTVGFEDVKLVVLPVLNHRILLSYRARMDKVDATTILSALVTKLSEVATALPKNLQISE